MNRSHWALIALLALPAGSAAAQSLGTPGEVLDFLVRNRKDAALVSVSVPPDGGSSPGGDPVVMVNADQAMPPGAAIDVVLLVAYAREVASGRLDPHDVVPVREWERFYLPDGADGSRAHAAALAALGLAANPDGSAVDADAPVSWDRIARAMVQYDDNAAADLLLDRIGDAGVRAALAEAGLARHPLPLSWLGVFLSWGNHEQGPLTSARLKKLSRLSPKAYAAETARLQARYLDEDWRAAELSWRADHPAAAGTARLQAQAARTLLPKSSARVYARLLAGVLQGTILSGEALAVMRGHLGWPMGEAGTAETFLTCGDKGGHLAGVLAEALYFTPKRGDFRSTPHVTVLFFRNLAPDALAGLAAGGGARQLALTLGLDRAFAEEAARRLSGRP